MDRFGNYTQVLTPMPGLHLALALGDRNLASDLVKLSNDGLAEYVTKYPDRFKGFAGLLPMNDPDQALIEIDRLMKMGALGIQIESNINGVPLDDHASNLYLQGWLIWGGRSGSLRSARH